MLTNLLFAAGPRASGDSAGGSGAGGSNGMFTLRVARVAALGVCVVVAAACRQLLAPDVAAPPSPASSALRGPADTIIDTSASAGAGAMHAATHAPRRLAAGCGDGIADPATSEFWIDLTIALVLVALAGLMSGLTVGFMSLDLLSVKAKASGRDAVERYQAQRVVWLVENQRLLLAALVLTNAASYEALPIFASRVVPEAFAILISVGLIVIFGEIVPQAVCTGSKKLAIASFFSPMVRAQIVLMYPIAWPVAKMIEKAVGDEGVGYFRRSELRALIKMHAREAGVEVAGTGSDFDAAGGGGLTGAEFTGIGVGSGSASGAAAGGGKPLTHKEAKLMASTLDFANHKVRDIMVQWKAAFKLPYESVLDHDTMAKMMAAGFSRVPVVAGGNPYALRGYVLVKRLIVVDPDDNRPMADMRLRRPVVVNPDIHMFTLLNTFQNGRSHIAVVTEQVDELKAYMREAATDPAAELDPSVKILGMLTIEDVLECLIDEDIEDERDVSLHHIESALDKVVTQSIGVRRAVAKFKGLLDRSARRRAAAATAAGSGDGGGDDGGGGGGDGDGGVAGGDEVKADA